MAATSPTPYVFGRLHDVLSGTLRVSAILGLMASCQIPADPAHPDGVSVVTSRIDSQQRSFQELDGVFVAHAGGVRAELGVGGLHARKGTDTVNFRLHAWGRDGAERASEVQAPIWGECASVGEILPDGSCLRRVELLHEGLTEFWQPADGLGLEHGWDIESRPGGAGLLSFHLVLEQAIYWTVDADGRGAEIVGSDGGSWRYEGLEAWDAVGEPVEAFLETTADGLALLVDDTGATYPLTVDPTLSDGLALTALNPEANAYFGVSVAGAGDVNGDGYGDVIVGADNDGNTGSAFVYLGTSTGIDRSTEVRLRASDGSNSDHFGQSVAGAGDVDGDGYDDVIVGAWYDDDNGTNAGSAYVYLGGVDGVQQATERKLLASDGAADDGYGHSVAGAGDVNGDGYHDVVIGAYKSDAGGSDSGSVYVYLGSAAGIDLGTEVEVTASDHDMSDNFGRSVAGAGDTNADGYDDIIVGAHNEDDQDWDAGAAYVFLGSGVGVDSATELKLTASDGAEGDWFGRSVAGAGDVDGDGYGDVVIGAQRFNDRGALYVYLGGSGGLDPATEVLIVASDAWYYDSFGGAVSGAGDVNDDGYDDIVVGAELDSDLGYAAGSSYVYLGSAAGIDAATEEELFASDPGQDYRFGVSVSGAGDVDGDGRDDVIVGSWFQSGAGFRAGAAYLFGSCVLSTYYADSDGDGHGDPDAHTTACSPAAGYSLDDTDCDDDDALAWPGNIEVCDGADNDCDGISDNDDAADSLTWYADGDGDGHGDPTVSVTACEQPSGYLADATDCDDDDALAWTDNIEVCDGADNDCDGISDNDDAADSLTWYGDGDGDGHGDPAVSVTACNQPIAYVADDTDCDDDEALAWTGNIEVCDGADNDCDGISDNDDAADSLTWYADGDGDGHGDPAASVTACDQPIGYVADDTDCNDAETLAWSDNNEVCDGVDNDCDGVADNDDAVDALTWYADMDGDGFGNPNAMATACDELAGYVADNTDCNDTESRAWIGNTEVCDGVDNDCDGLVDNDAADALTWYGDGDGDGYGDPTAAMSACAQPEGYLSDDSDCDDGDASIHPDADHDLEDDIDQDCDGPDVAFAEGKTGGCNCSSSPSSATGVWFGLLLVLAVVRSQGHKP